ncbi:MAG: alpha-glucan family phosphorylase [Mobiluncus sp.]|uniref:alpha-glucan family phosphorylase n=1 Tax=Mobiluncus TaxID=2050 RepID=UPI00258A5183|nr:alpha-glucan family phosphorylase [Mobiluncus sp.]MCI6584082.1 alpha-glucan family phosphorylase [Mobiluncus sp.]
MKAIRRFTVRSVLPDNLKPLANLAQNLRWSWHRPTRDFFASLDPQVWDEVGHDPVAFLGSVSTEKLAELSANPDIVNQAQELDRGLSDYLSKPLWFESEFNNADKPKAIAYFSAEFGITAVLPQYSGGLGILAGDHLKSASDLGVPIIGVGLLYQAGYFRQSLTREGWQRESYPVIDPDNLPLSLLRQQDGSPAYVSIPLPDRRTLWAQIWVAKVGRIPLLLLDSDVAKNDEATRLVTDRLYGGSKDHRMEQELLLGVGGVKALRLFSELTGAPTPEVYHCNEGHAGFMAVERIRELMNGEERLDFGTAIEAVRSGTLFTTHTPVPAGIDRFDRGLAQRYLSAIEIPGVTTDQILSLGAESYEGGDPNVFNMAVFGLRMARMANGVAKLHGKVSRGMFHSLWPNFDVTEVPITSITNGVHGPTWTDGRLAELARGHQDPGEHVNTYRWVRPASEGGVSDEELWQLRRDLRLQLVKDARRRVKASWLERGASPAELAWCDEILDPDTLTIGFARRVPTYKRLTLMINDPERLAAILTNKDRPVQIIVAGKSHPDDEQGVSLIQQLVHFADQHGVRDRIAFLPNYDMDMAQILMPGVDVWLNNPLRPLEASGTSGMKCALNGALNLSILDGWWDELYDGRNGWAIPTADGVDDPVRRDQIEAAGLYDLIENTVAPRFYDRDENGVPRHWMEMVRHTLATLGPQVQAQRMVSEYVEKLYTPVAASSRRLNALGHSDTRSLADYKARVRSAWPQISVNHVVSEVGDTATVGDEASFFADVQLGNLRPEDVEVQVVFGRVTPDDTISSFQTLPMNCVGEENGLFKYQLVTTLKQAGPYGYLVRVVPHNDMMAGFTELGLATNAERASDSPEVHFNFGS